MSLHPFLHQSGITKIHDLAEATAKLSMEMDDGKLGVGHLGSSVLRTPSLKEELERIPKRKFNLEDFNFIKVLGKGSFGKVSDKFCFSV